MTSPDLEFVGAIVGGHIDDVARRLADSRALATSSSGVGATRADSSSFFLADIAHYLYAGDTALHVAAAAFRRQVAALLVAHGADCRARNRRGAEPLHYAADANRWNPAAQAETIGYPNATRGCLTPLSSTLTSSAPQVGDGTAVVRDPVDTSTIYFPATSTSVL